MLPKKIQSTRLFVIGSLLSILPDADIIAFRFGIPYSHILGHRGFTHSIAFGLFMAWLAHLIFFRKKSSMDKLGNTRIFYFFICCASHGILDAMTTGGRGSALLFPFSYDRIFFGFRPILVSPIGASNFFSSWGLQVLWSEIIWILIPCLFILFLTNQIKKYT